MLLSVKRCELPRMGIVPILLSICRIGACISCYNIVTSYTPPMALGRLELPRHKATEFQARPVCQFQHSATDTGKEISLPEPSFPVFSLFKQYTRNNLLSTLNQYEYQQ